MVYLKNGTIIFFAFICAFIITEVITYYILGFPRWGVEKQIYGIKPWGKKISEIYLPYSEYFNYENGYNVFRRNNLGLNGIDIDTTSAKKRIFLVGDSYLSGEQINPAKLSSSILQKNLDSAKYSVMNLGFGGGDPFSMYFKSIYYAQKYEPKYVVIILSHSYNNLMETRYTDLNFSLPPEFGKRKKVWLFSDEEVFLCNRSSIAYMFDIMIKKKEKQIDNFPLPLNKEISTISPKIIDCLRNFKTQFNNKFILVSIIEDNGFNGSLNDFCTDNEIKYFSRKINVPGNKIKSTGHLNEKGNKILGDFLFKIITTVENE